MQIVFGEGESVKELIIREGDAAKILDPMPPVKTDLSGVIGAPVEFLRKRLDGLVKAEIGQIIPERCHVIVDRENITLELVINEHDEYLKGSVVGTLIQHPKFSEFGINSKKNWTPNDLGQYFKMNRAFFNDMEENMKLVSNLKNFIADVNAKIEKQKDDSGSFKDNFSGVVTSNLPGSFKLHIPLFKGTPPEDIEVEFYANVSGREVTLQLFSPGACQLTEEIRDKVIDDQIFEIRTLSPGIAIIEK